MNRKQLKLRCIIGIVVVLFVLIFIVVFLLIYQKKQNSSIPLKEAVEMTCFESETINQEKLAEINKEQLADHLINNLNQTEHIPGKVLRQLDQTVLKQDLIRQIDQLEKNKLLTSDPDNHFSSTEANAHLANALGNAVTKQLGNLKVAKQEATIGDKVNLSSLEKKVDQVKDSADRTDYIEQLRLRIEALDTLVNSIKNTPLKNVSSDVQTQITSLAKDLQRNEEAGTTLRKEMRETIEELKHQLEEKQLAISQICSKLEGMQKNQVQPEQLEQIRSGISSDFETKLLNMNHNVGFQIENINAFLDESLNYFDELNRKWMNDSSVKMNNIQNEFHQAVEYSKLQDTKLEQKINHIDESNVWIIDVCLNKDEWSPNASNQYVYEYPHPSIKKTYTNIYIDYQNPVDAGGIFYEQKEGSLLFIRDTRPDKDIYINSIKIEQPGKEDVNEEKNT